MSSNRILIAGPSGSGKTLLAKYFKERGVNAIDADGAGIGIWCDKAGNEFEPAPGMEMSLGQWAFEMGLRWNWDPLKLKLLLDKNPEIYLFGNAYNIYYLAGFFDRKYYLDADAGQILGRLISRSDSAMNHHGWGDTEEQRIVILNELEAEREKAEHAGFEFVQARLTPKQIFNIIHLKVNAAGCI